LALSKECNNSDSCNLIREEGCNKTGWYKACNKTALDNYPACSMKALYKLPANSRRDLYTCCLAEESGKKVSYSPEESRIQEE